MGDAVFTSQSAQAAARARWRGTRVDRLAQEIANRPDDLSPNVRAQLAKALQPDHEENRVSNTDPESRRRYLDALDGDLQDHVGDLGHGEPQVLRPDPARARNRHQPPRLRVVDHAISTDDRR
jgi:hypothetical protein